MAKRPAHGTPTRSARREPAPTGRDPRRPSRRETAPTGRDAMRTAHGTQTRSAPRTPPPTARVPPDARRRQLLDEAARLLTEHGIEQLQITEVATRVGVSRPLVYRQFPTRQALVRALLEDFTAL